MALIVETGSGVSGANSYVSLSDAQAFIDARELSVSLTEGHLLRAMDSLAGVELRSDAINSSVPQGLINAQIWLAFYIASGHDPAAVPEPAVRAERVDVIDISYAVRDGDMTKIDPLELPNVKRALSGLLAVSGIIHRA